MMKMSSLFINMSIYFKECILIFITTAFIEVQRAKESSGYDHGDDDGLIKVENVRLHLKQEACKEDIKDFHDDVL